MSGNKVTIAAILFVTALATTANADVNNVWWTHLDGSANPALLLATSAPTLTPALAESPDETAEAVLPMAEFSQAALSTAADAFRDVPDAVAVNATDHLKLNAANDQIPIRKAGFSLQRLFRSNQDGSVLSVMVTLAVIGLAIGGARLEMLRRRAEQAAFYGPVVTTGHRRRRRSSHAGHARSSHATRRHRKPRRRTTRVYYDYQPTHPITIEGRLAG